MEVTAMFMQCNANSKRLRLRDEIPQEYAERQNCHSNKQENNCKKNQFAPGSKDRQAIKRLDLIKSSNAMDSDKNNAK